MADLPSTVAPLPFRPRFEVADVVRRYGPAYRQAHPLPLQHLRVLSAIERCRTAALGGHVDGCDDCGRQRITYNSCRNRHCPKCQGAARDRWAAARSAELLPIEYFHVVFTLPEQLNPVIRWNQRLLLNLLFRAVSQTLLAFGHRHLGGEIGITAVLHTWGQTLVEHPHLHCIVTGGALSRDGQQFVRCPRGYLFPVRALAQVYRSIFCTVLQQAFARNLLAGQAALPMLASRLHFIQFLRSLWQRPWVVYAKRPCAGPAQVIAYLSRYTHRIAISNQRLVGIAGGTVSFRWKDYRAGGQHKVMTLPADEFLRRFLLHVLPPGFVRIRHYGLLANGRSHAKLARCRTLLRVLPAAPRSPELSEQREPSWWESAGRCGRCGGQLVRQQTLPPSCGPPPRTVGGHRA